MVFIFLINGYSIYIDYDYRVVMIVQMFLPQCTARYALAGWSALLSSPLSLAKWPPCSSRDACDQHRRVMHP
jgi:hypothetical protein